MEHADVAIVIPAFNESATIGRVASQVCSFGQPIVVDDYSSDNTAEIARRGGAIVVQHLSNKGYDAALNTGFETAHKLGFQYIITFDADGQHDPSLLQDFIFHLKQGIYLVLGTRKTKARWAELCFSLYTRIRFGVPDPLCGMKGYRTILYCEKGCFDSYNSIGTELALYGLKRNYPSTRVSVPIYKRQDAPRFGSVIKANLKILRAMMISMYIFR